MYTKESLERLKEEIDIIDLIEDDIDLIEEEYADLAYGSCPFCDSAEEHYDFVLSRDKGTYYCFNCHASGDPVSYLMLTRKMTFEEAVSWLSAAYDLSLEKIDPIEPKERLPDCPKCESYKRLVSIQVRVFNKIMAELETK